MRGLLKKYHPNHVNVNNLMKKKKRKKLDSEAYHVPLLSWYRGGTNVIYRGEKRVQEVLTNDTLT